MPNDCICPGRRCLLAVLSAMCSAIGRTYATQIDFSALQPTTVFAQAGVGDQRTRAYVAGATWNWDWSRDFAFLAVSGFYEAAIGRWATDERGVSSLAWATQVGLTPALRLQRSVEANSCFAEIGVGGNYIVPLYRTGHKRFSTEFNFGDHLGIGRHFGKHRERELILRVQHFSNAGIEHPNPGENFVQLRYAHRL